CGRSGEDTRIALGLQSLRGEFPSTCKFGSVNRECSAMDGILERAARWGLETEYRDAFGILRTVEREVLARILHALAEGRDVGDRILPRTIVVRDHLDRPLRLGTAEGLPVRWEIFLQRKIAAGEGISPVLALPPLSQNGIYLLRVTVISPTGQLVQDVCLVVCRDRAYQGDQTAPRRMWALGVQLYGI